MSEVNLKEMLEAGVHFGHKKERWNPKMRSFIFTERNGVHIFDLAKTKEGLEAAMKFAGQVAADGGTILFIGTKNQTKEVIKTAAENAGMPYLVERWPGGMLTNFNTVVSRLKYLKDHEENTSEGVSLTKKEALNLSRELDKLRVVFEGVKELRRLPDALFVADIVKEKIAVREAKRLGIPVIGIADTNASPDIEYIIPGNDDAVRAVKYIADKIAESVLSHRVTEAPVVPLESVTASPAETEDDLADEKLEKIEMQAEEAVVVKKSKPSETTVAK